MLSVSADMQPSPATLRVPRQSRSLRTRAAIVSAAWAEFERRGYAETTAKSIAEAARVGTGSFYHYFPDKDAVLREIALERAEYWREQSESLAAPFPRGGGARGIVARGRARLARLVDLSIAYHRKDRGLHAVIAERRLSDDSLDRILSASERDAVARTAASLAHVGYDGDAEAAAIMMFSLLEGAVHGHVLGQAFISDARFSEGLVEALIRIAIPPSQLTVGEHAR